MTINKVQSST
ncbi:hypothetical protein FWK35_00000552 [Aphis craccivora]|uniref:Uncharacterized protein n=1 Tax=Aphis craccivora TaxID=307492 RepID=A0A6G0ZQA6_APHCR|nr:hypothetical protein FWK35_00000552 [Aphis craccivora]